MKNSNKIKRKYLKAIRGAQVQHCRHANMKNLSGHMHMEEPNRSS